ncbi:semaphorin-7A isoform X2 [Electrophorus electricus]|uniref:semaphorin-7A isoform X2 n=1 Tax=Electrophorus electricus TaxID=8005 RepID=UPI0015D09866|nr:semaphorin-7A isoform X2 [Electrophorus electricus]
MTFPELCVSLSVLWITPCISTHDGHHSEVRIKVNHIHMPFPTLQFPNPQINTMVKLVKDPSGTNIYAGSPQGLYIFKGDSGKLAPVHMPLFESDCHGKPNCEYIISVLDEGTNGNSLFMCWTGENVKKCCNVNSNHKHVDCFIMETRVHIKEPSLHIGGMLFFTFSGVSDDQGSVGLYKYTNSSYTWPSSSDREQRYIKIIADRGSGSLKGKLYFLYIEKNTNPDPETPLWIPRVSQICMDDKGGVKNQLQFRWTSMLTARLFCGDAKKRISFTELLDVAVVETEHWNSTKIYALFRNEYNLSAICVYKMADIIYTFAKSKFIEKDEMPDSNLHRPGECVPGKNFPPNFLKFMENRPEMEDWVRPARDAVLISHHHQYTHLQVDHVEGKGTVLVIALESGRVHKVLEQDGEAFFIAEYQPFTSPTRVQSMLLDSLTKQLYVSSSSEVVRVELRNCSLYGTQCCSCVLARDPYCGWSTSSCLPAKKHSIQDLDGNCSVCQEPSKALLQDKPQNTPPTKIITEGSEVHLNCPALSHHASYTWYQGNRRRFCFSTRQGCLLVIANVSQEDQGTYRCLATENGQNLLLASYKLSINSGPCARATPLVSVCLLLLLSVIC